MAFGVKMTNRAREIGLTKSTFTNSTGLHNPGLKVTARELGKLAQHIIRTYPDFYKIYGEREFTYNKIRQYNRNPLLAWGADGLKTGFTKESGYGLVASAEQNGMRLIVVVMGAKGEKERADEARKLLEWGFRSFEARILFAEGQTVGEAKVFGGEKGYVPLVGARHDPADGAAQCQRKDRRARHLYRSVARAGGAGTAGGRAEGLARRYPRAGSPAANR